MPRHLRLERWKSRPIARHVSDLHPKFALRHTMRGSMADIQSPTAEIRRGKKKRRKKKKPQAKNIMSASATQGGHKNVKNAKT